PPIHQLPFGEVLFDLHRQAGSVGYGLGGPECPLQRRGPDADDGLPAQVAGNGPGLFLSWRRQPESGQRGVDQMIGVVDLTVTDEMNAGSHACREASCVGHPRTPRSPSGHRITQPAVRESRGRRFAFPVVGTGPSAPVVRLRLHIRQFATLAFSRGFVYWTPDGVDDPRPRGTG